MTTVHRFIIALNSQLKKDEPTPATVMMPAGAKVLAIGISQKGLALFAQVDPALEPEEPRQFVILPTGVPAHVLGPWVASFTPIGAPAFHVFEAA